MAGSGSGFHQAAVGRGWCCRRVMAQLGLEDLLPTSSPSGLTSWGWLLVGGLSYFPAQPLHRVARELPSLASGFS